jgi:NTP pyrophosphatase (non-canonical NTP hydrolase)|tara:strand:- start:1800 stop:2204 length:405 start_codon:yes stop_codon:yes gene_type:complete
LAKWNISKIEKAFNKEPVGTTIHQDHIAPALTLNDYQNRAHKTAIYPVNKSLEYLITGLASEVGEVSGKVAKYYRKDGEFPKEAVLDELGDVLWFVAELSTMLGSPLSKVAIGNIDKLASRKDRGVLKGSGDNR